MDIAANVLDGQAAQGLLPSLQTLAQSPTLKSAIEREYPLEPFSFPHSKETCEREKREGDPDFNDIDCNAKDICSNPSYDKAVIDKVCFKLPCTIFEGDQQVGKCNGTSDLYPKNISFPSPIDIQNIKLSPTKVEYKDNVANLCFKIDELSLNLSTKLDFDISGTDLKDRSIEVSNINPVLDQPREICMSADIKLGSSNPVSNIRLTPQGTAPLISDAMIRTASSKLAIKGLSGYREEDLAAIQSEVVPALFQPMRHSIEKAVQDSLGQVFTEKIEETLQPILSGRTMTVDSSSFMSELGINNITVKNQLAKVECAHLKAAKKQIPANHACIGLPHFPGPTVTQDFDASPNIERSKLVDMIKGHNITSENVKRRLQDLIPLMREEKVSDFFTEGRTPEEIADLEEWHKDMFEENIQTDILPLIEEISQNQLKDQMYSIVGIQNQLNEGISNSIGLVLPEICTPQASPHAGRKMNGCPIQVYADLIEFNKVLEKMWDTGRICMKGQGEFRPKLDANGKDAYNSSGKPLVNGGCEIEVSGMSCYIKNPPQLKYDNKTKKYKVDLKLKSCFRGPVILGIGKFGGDFNINLDFKPKACSNGDFCMDDVNANWSVVPGSERFDLRESSWFDELIKDKIDGALKNAIKDTIRIPMASGVGPLGNVPLQAEGRVDSGPGYFGVCLEIPKGSAQQ